MSSGPEPDENIVAQLKERMLSTFETVARRTPFPERLPFDVVLFAYGAVPMSDDQAHARLSESTWRAAGIERVALVGHLLGTFGGEHHHAYVVLRVHGRDAQHREHEGTAFIEAWGAAGWTQALTFDASVLDALAAMVDEHKVLVREAATERQRMIARAGAKGAPREVRPVLPPFYACPLRDEVVDEHMRGQAARVPRNVQWSHRWDVRGHERVRVKRGALPIDPKLEAKLKARGYVVATWQSPLPRETAALLKHRGVDEPARDQWLAVKRYHVEPHVKGPEGKPYVPALRVMQAAS